MAKKLECDNCGKQVDPDESIYWFEARRNDPRGEAVTVLGGPVVKSQWHWCQWTCVAEYAAKQAGG